MFPSKLTLKPFANSLSFIFQAIGFEIYKIIIYQSCTEKEGRAQRFDQWNGTLEVQLNDSHLSAF